MIKKILIGLLIGLCIIFPIISIEDLIPWVIALIFVHKSCKIIGKDNDIKRIAMNTALCGGIILAFNIVAKIIESYLVKLLL